MSSSNDLPQLPTPLQGAQRRSLLLHPNIQFEASRIKKDEPIWRVRFGGGAEMRGTWPDVEDCVWRAIDGAKAQ